MKLRVSIEACERMESCIRAESFLRISAYTEKAQVKHKYTAVICFIIKHLFFNQSIIYDVYLFLVVASF